MILVHFVPLNLGILIILLNIPFLLYASKQIGRVFLLKAAYAMAMFSFMLAVFRDMQNATEDLLLATGIRRRISGSRSRNGSARRRVS